MFPRDGEREREERLRPYPSGTRAGWGREQSIRIAEEVPLPELREVQPPVRSGDLEKNVLSGLILTLTLTLVHPTRIHPSKNEKKRLEFLEKRLEFLEFKVGGLALRLLHADLSCQSSC